MIDKSIRYFFRVECQAALDRNPGPGNETLSKEIFVVHVPIDSSTHYLAFYKVRLHSQTPTLLVGKAGRQFFSFL